MAGFKKIHYCWFGGNPLPDLAKKCIASWKKFCPDYEIIEWNESNFDINCNAYVKEAYQAKKWAFVSDYCRFYILYNYGGIYLDTDVELLKSLDELPNTFVGFESPNYVASGLIRAAEPNDEICGLMLETYEKDIFSFEGGKTLTVCERETEILKGFGLQANGTMQQIKGTVVFPMEYFCPLNPITWKLNITKNTYSIHHYDGSWLLEEDKLAIRLTIKYRKFMPRKLAGYLGKFNAIKKIHGFKQACKEFCAWRKRK